MLGRRGSRSDREVPLEVLSEGGIEVTLLVTLWPFYTTREISNSRLQMSDADVGEVGMMRCFVKF